MGTPPYRVGVATSGGRGPALIDRSVAAGTAACGSPGRPSRSRTLRTRRGTRVACPRCPPCWHPRSPPRRKQLLGGCWGPPGAPASPCALSCGASACWRPPSPPSCWGSPWPVRSAGVRVGWGGPAVGWQQHGMTPLSPLRCLRPRRKQRVHPRGHDPRPARAGWCARPAWMAAPPRFVTTPIVTTTPMHRATPTLMNPRLNLGVMGQHLLAAIATMGWAWSKHRGVVIVAARPAHAPPALWGWEVPLLSPTRTDTDTAPALAIKCGNGSPSWPCDPEHLEGWGAVSRDKSERFGGTGRA